MNRAWLRAMVGAWTMWAAAAVAAEPQRTLVVGVEELDYRPAYGWHDGAFGGAGRDILEAFAAARGYHLDFRPLPVKRLFAQLVHHEIDLKFPDNPAWAPDLKEGHRVAYSQPVIRYTDGVMVLADKPVPTADAIKTLGTVGGFTPIGWQSRIAAGTVAVKETTRVELAVSQVLRGFTDGAYVNVAVANRVLTEMGRPQALVFAAHLPHATGAYALSSDAHPDLVAEFDAWLEANTATVQAIKARWGAETGVGQ